MKTARWKTQPLAELLVAHFDGAWGEAASNSDGVPVLRSTNMRGGRLDLISPEPRLIPTKTIEKKRLMTGDLLVNKSSGSAHLVGQTVLFEGDTSGKTYLCSNFIHCLRPNQKMVLPPFLHLSLLAPQFREQVFRSHHTTSGLRNLNLSEHLAASVSWPDFAEQQRIVECVTEALIQIDEMEHERTSIEEEVSLLEQAFIRQRLAALALQTGKVTLEKLADIRGGNVLPKGDVLVAKPDDWLLVKVGDMNLPGNEWSISTAREYLRPRAKITTWPEHTVIFPKRGGAIATNKKRVLARTAVLDPNLMGIVAFAEKVRPRFLLAQLLLLDLATLSNGSTVPQLNRKDLAPLLFIAPSIEAQDRFLEEWDEFATGARAMAKDCSNAGEGIALRQAILREAFAGNL